MATNFLWGAVGSVVNLLTTELNSLANAAGTALGPEVNNTAAGIGAYQMCQLTVHLASAAFTATSYIYVMFVLSMNTAGNTYPTTTTPASVPIGNYLADTIYIYPSTAAQDEAKQGVLMPVGKFKTIAVNKTGVTLGASGNTVDAYPTPTQY